MGRQSAPKTGTLVKRNLPKKMPSVIGNRYTAAANARSIGSTASSAIRTAAVAARVGWRSGACTERAGDKARAGANAYAGAHTSASTMHDVRMPMGDVARTVSEVQGGSTSGHAEWIVDADRGSKSGDLRRHRSAPSASNDTTAPV